MYIYTHVYASMCAHSCTDAYDGHLPISTLDVQQTAMQHCTAEHSFLSGSVCYKRYRRRAERDG